MCLLLLLSFWPAVSSALHNHKQDLERFEVDKNKCSWSGRAFGQLNQCAPNAVVVGSCGSGAVANCANNTAGHELRCCEQPDFRRTDCSLSRALFPGMRITCPIRRRSRQFFVNGACGSGALFDCGFKIHTVDCCRGLLDSGSWLSSSGVCYWRYGTHGERVECVNDDEIVFGRCGSGVGNDCGGGGRAHGIQCCTVVKEIQRKDRKERSLNLD